MKPKVDIDLQKAFVFVEITDGASCCIKAFDGKGTPITKDFQVMNLVELDGKKGFPFNAIKPTHELIPGEEIGVDVYVGVADKIGEPTRIKLIPVQKTSSTPPVPPVPPTPPKNTPKSAGGGKSKLPSIGIFEGLLWLAALCVIVFAAVYIFSKKNSNGIKTTSPAPQVVAPLVEPANSATKPALTNTPVSPAIVPAVVPVTKDGVGTHSGTNTGGGVLIQGCNHGAVFNNIGTLNYHAPPTINETGGGLRVSQSATSSAGSMSNKHEGKETLQIITVPDDFDPNIPCEKVTLNPGEFIALIQNGRWTVEIEAELKSDLEYVDTYVAGDDDVYKPLPPTNSFRGINRVWLHSKHTEPIVLMLKKYQY